MHASELTPHTHTARNSHSRRGTRLLAALLLTLLLPVAAGAYTLVMRSGRRVELPENFKASASAITFEAAAGVHVSIQLNSIDIEATERLNGEPKGAFMRRVLAAQTASVATAAAARRQNTAPDARSKVVTNRDLEVFRQERLRKEEAEAKARAERGEPSPAETPQQTEERDEKLIELGRQLEAAQTAEEYENLRKELSALRLQLNALAVQQTQTPAAYVPYPFYTPYATSTTYVFTLPSPFFRHGGHRTHYPDPRQLNPYPFGRVFNPFPRLSLSPFSSGISIRTPPVNLRLGAPQPLLTRPLVVAPIPGGIRR